MLAHQQTPHWLKHSLIANSMSKRAIEKKKKTLRSQEEAAFRNIEMEKTAAAKCPKTHFFGVVCPIKGGVTSCQEDFLFFLAA